MEQHTPNGESCAWHDSDGRRRITVVRQGSRSRSCVPVSPESGYTMVMFFIILAVMAIMMGAAVQLASFSMQREKEAELIFRGQQYAEAIRQFQQKFGRLPVTLKEIWEADPKVIRRPFKDPILDTEDWGLIFVGQDGKPISPSQPTGLATPTPTPTPRRGEGTPLGGIGTQQQGPITGVFSKSCETSIKIYEGHTRYCDWKFAYRQQRNRTNQPNDPNDPNATPTPEKSGTPSLPRETPYR
jgi:type II secretory pathway pseudopilin PulG